MHYLIQGHIVLNAPNEPLPVSEEIDAGNDMEAMRKTQERANELYTKHNQKWSRTKATMVYLQAIPQIRPLAPVIANDETDGFCKLQARLLEKKGIPTEEAKKLASRILLMTV